MKKTHGILPDLSIALLLCSAVFLAAAIWAQALGKSYPWELWQRETVSLPEAYADYEELSPAIELVQPLRCAACGEEGGFSVSADREEAGLGFSSAASLLAEAMETGLTADVSGGAETLLYWDFGGALPVSLLCRTLGVERTYEGSFRFLTLGCQGEKTLLLLYGEDGAGSRYETAISAAALRETAAAVREKLSDTGFFRDSVLFGNRNTYPVLRTENLLQTEQEQRLTLCLQSFDFSAYGVSLYRDTDGELVYVQEERSLRVREQDGSVRYDSGAEGGRSSSLTPQEEALVIGRASHIAGALMAGNLYLIESEYLPESGLYQVLIGMEYGGIRILTENGYAARFLFRGTELYTAELQLLRCTETKESSVLLPARQAAAAADLRDYAIYYAEEEGQLHPGWYGKSEE